MSRALKWFHVACLVGLCCAMAVLIAFEHRNPALATRVAGACLFGLIVSGMLLLASRPGYLERRWLLAKLLLTMVIAPCVWLRPTPAVLLLTAGLTLLATVLAVWKPRLGAPPQR
ncbi:MAG: hypothetical protein EOO26_11085 [Comamonadaceae bacterium]|nr:MAG: hypothetical protein EOO26_11085 [Comamonadaceae bacterium]